MRENISMLIENLSKTTVENLKDRSESLQTMRDLECETLKEECTA